MQKYTRAAILLFMFFFLTGMTGSVAFGQTHHNKSKHPAPSLTHSTKLNKHRAAPVKEKLPLTFTCKHCGRKMTIQKPGDWKKICWVCGCKKQATACHSPK